MLKKIQKLFQKKQQNNTDLLFTKCNELPIHNFNEIANNNDFSYLKRDRNSVVSDELIQSIWVDILDEFISISKNTYAVNVIKKKSKIMLLELRLKVFETLKYCSIRGVNIDSELQHYRMTKESISINIGLMRNDISRLKGSLPDENEKKANQCSLEFDRTIAILNKNGFQIKRFTTVVTEWVQALNILEQQNKANKE